MMPVMLPPTLPPRASAPARAHDALDPGAGWRRRIRLSLEAQRLRDLRLHPHDLSLFSGNQVHLIRVDGRLFGGWPTPRWEWVPAVGPGPDSKRLGPIGRLDHLTLPAFELPPRFQTPPTPDRAGAGNGGSASGTSASASGVVGAGAAVLALAALVLLARALERCLDQRLFKLLRRRSDEWFTPNVLATSNQAQTDQDAVEVAGLDCSNIPPGDPPPPYSTCLPKSPRSPEGAEPPPPYSACYVAFGGPQDSLPRVHLNVPTFNSFQDTGQPIEADGTNIIHSCTVTLATEAPEYSSIARNSYEDSESPAESRSSTAAVQVSEAAALSPNNLVA